MKGIFIFCFSSLIWFLGCKKSEVVNEKLIFDTTDIKKCSCFDKTTSICYFDTVKHFLVNLEAVEGTLLKRFTSDIIGHIQLDNPTKYINGKAEFGEPFYYWTIMNGYLSPCNLPEEIASNKEYVGRRVRFSVDALPVLPPPKGLSYPSIEGYPVILKKIEILAK